MKKLNKEQKTIADSSPGSVANAPVGGSRSRYTKYTYYRIDFEDWSEEFDYTIVETLEDILIYLKAADIDLDDPERETKVIISGVGMTPEEFEQWQDENQP